MRLRTEIAGQAPREDLGIYHHFTVAIDTDNIKKVFDAVKDMAKGSQIFFKLLGFLYMGTLKKPRKIMSRSSEARAFYTLNHRGAPG